MGEEYVKIKLPKNPLIVLILILGVLLLVAIIFIVFSIMGVSQFNAQKISPNQAGQKAIAFLNSETNSSIQLKNVTEMSGVYQIYVSYQNEVLPIYATEDGKYLLEGAIPLN